MRDFRSEELADALDVGERVFDNVVEQTGCDSDDVELEEGDTIDSVLAYYARARAASDRAITELDLDTTATTWLGAPQPRLSRTVSRWAAGRRRSRS